MKKANKSQIYLHECIERHEQKRVRFRINDIESKLGDQSAQSIVPKIVSITFAYEEEIDLTKAIIKKSKTINAKKSDFEA